MDNRPPQTDWEAWLCAYVGGHFSAGNKIDLLVHGREIFNAMLEAIRNAKRSIYFITYIFAKGRLADQFTAALAERARAGVKVYVIFDGFGSLWITRSAIDRLREDGVDVAWFRPPRLHALHWVLYRTHRKLLLVDQEVAFTGGVGVAEEWDWRGRQQARSWRDYHFRVRGPVVRELMAGFVDSWGCARRALLPITPRPYPPQPLGQARALMVRSNGPAQWSDIRTVFEVLLANARHRVRIATAYFLPDAGMIDLLCQRARDGVAVDLLLPGPHIDHLLPQLAGDRWIGCLLEAGVRVWRFTPTMFHAKALLVDDRLAFVGSANFNRRSLYQDQELCLLVEDPALCQSLDAQIDLDCAASTRLDLAQWQRRPWRRKAGEWLVGLAPPVL